MTNKIVVLSTCGSEHEAEQLARKLVDEKLAACVTILPPVKSVYRWNGALTDSAEWMLIIKTSRPLFANLKTTLESNHTYEVPEVIALPIIEGSTNYMAWLDSELLAS